MRLVIKRLLSAGAKTPRRLREAVTGRTGVSDRVYYQHVSKLLKRGEIEEVFEEAGGGRKIKKFALRREVKEAKGESVVAFQSLDFPASRRLLELAAWIRFQPEGWAENDDVKKAKQLLKYDRLIPKVEASHEDPDKHALIWPSPEFGAEPGALTSRFFSLKSIYQVVGSNRIEPLVGDVFVAACFSPQTVEYKTFHLLLEWGWQPPRLENLGEPWVVGGPHSVAVAVCRGADGVIHVVHVEKREEGNRWEIDGKWVKGIAQQYKAKQFRAYNRLDEDFKREIMLNLREVIEQRKISIPGRYGKLIEELMDYSYNKPSNAYVPALAAAVALCT